MPSTSQYKRGYYSGRWIGRQLVQEVLTDQGRLRDWSHYHGQCTPSVLTCRLIPSRPQHVLGYEGKSVAIFTFAISSINRVILVDIYTDVFVVVIDEIGARQVQNSVVGHLWDSLYRLETKCGLQYRHYRSKHGRSTGYLSSVRRCVIA